MATAPQPFLHDLVTCFAAPTAVLSGGDGQLRQTGAQGVLHADVRVLSRAVVTVDGVEPEPVAAASGGTSGTAHFTAVVRSLGERGPDPTALLERWRTVTAGLLEERLVLVNGGSSPVHAVLGLDLAADLASVESVKAGRPAPSGALPVLLRDGERVTGWHGGSVAQGEGAAAEDVSVQVELRATVRLLTGGRVLTGGRPLTGGRCCPDDSWLGHQRPAACQLAGRRPGAQPDRGAVEPARARRPLGRRPRPEPAGHAVRAGMVGAGGRGRRPAPGAPGRPLAAGPGGPANGDA